MRSLKFKKLFLFLGLVILLICCPFECKNPHGPDWPPPPPNGDEIVTVNYTGTAVTATTSKWQLTLNKAWTEDVLVDLEGRTLRPNGQWLIIEIEAKYVGSIIADAIDCEMLKIVNGNSSKYSADPYTAKDCFDNALWTEVLESGERTGPKILVFDIPKNATNLMLVFHREYTGPKVIEIRFKLLNLE